MAIRAVFFDLGGTLLVMRRDRIISRILTDAGFPVGPERVHSAYFEAEPSWLAVYGEKAMSGEETEEAYRQLDTMIFRLMYPSQSPDVVEKMSSLTRRLWPQVEKTVPLELYPDAVPTLEKLKSEGYALGLISNAPPGTVKVIESLGLRRYLTTVVVSGVVGVSKPNPEIFRIALRDADVRAGESLHVGDIYDADILGARNAGIKGVLIDRDGSQAGLDCPRVSTLSEIYPHLK